MPPAAGSEKADALALNLDNKNIRAVLLVFVLFFILSRPQIAGPQAREFFGWLSDGAQAAGTFLEGLFSDDTTPSQTTS